MLTNSNPLLTISLACQLMETALTSEGMVGRGFPMGIRGIIIPEPPSVESESLVLNCRLPSSGTTTSPCRIISIWWPEWWEREREREREREKRLVTWHCSIASQRNLTVHAWGLLPKYLALHTTQPLAVSHSLEPGSPGENLVRGYASHSPTL